MLIKEMWKCKSNFQGDPLIWRPWSCFERKQHTKKEYAIRWNVKYSLKINLLHQNHLSIIVLFSWSVTAQSTVRVQFCIIGTRKGTAWLRAIPFRTLFWSRTSSGFFVVSFFGSRGKFRFMTSTLSRLSRCTKICMRYAKRPSSMPLVNCRERRNRICLKFWPM